MTIIAKILAAFFAIVVISRSVTDYRSKKESLTMTAFWIIVWLAIAAIAFFPTLVDEAIRLSDDSRSGLGTVFGMGLVFVLFISYRIYVKANRVEKALAKLARDFCLSKIKDEKK